MCGNPWNDFTEEESERIKETRPAVHGYPASKPLTRLLILDEKEAEKAINKWVDLKCWAIHTRKHIDLTSTHLFYIHKDVQPEIGEEREERVKGEKEICEIQDGELLAYLNAHPGTPLSPLSSPLYPPPPSPSLNC
jgi:hypothetical protein